MSQQHKETGRIKLIGETQTFPSGFSKREFVITTDDDKFPQYLKFEVVKDKCEALEHLQEGQEITVHFNIKGNEYNGKYYVNLQCWKWEAGEAPQRQQRREEPKNMNVPSNRKQDDQQPEDDDDIPF